MLPTLRVIQAKQGMFRGQRPGDWNHAIGVIVKKMGCLAEVRKDLGQEEAGCDKCTQSGED